MRVMSIDVRCEDGELLGDRIGQEVQQQQHRESAASDRSFYSAFPTLHEDDEEQDRLAMQEDLSQVSTYVNTGSAEATPPLTPHIRPKRKVDPRLSVSTSVKAWRQLDD
jgi:hypothetical protein